MKLFRRFLLSLFPNDFSSNGMNPVSMFVSFISPKQFFSVIHRKVVENYKLNHYDIGLDPFEVKIGFGEQPTVQVKDIDFYYAYGSVSNLNGWKFYAPGNMATAVSTMSAVVTRKLLKPFPGKYATSLYITIYLLSFLFSARMRVFPYADQEQNFQWFVETFFSFYRFVIKRRYKTDSEKIFGDIKVLLLKELPLLFFLYHYCLICNELLVTPGMSDREFYQRLFHDELRKSKWKHLLQEFIVNAKERTASTEFEEREKEMLEMVLPADLQIKFIFTNADRFLVTDKLLSRVYEPEKIHDYLLSFLKGSDRIEEFLEYLTDYKLFKTVYFQGIKKVTSMKFRMTSDYETSKEIDEFMSSIEEAGSVEGIKIPEKLKQEGALMDKLVNFYISFLGGLCIGRGDSFYLRVTKKSLVSQLLQLFQQTSLKQDALYYYGGLLYNYSKNVYYYKYAFENVRAGVDSFSLPTKGSFKEVYSNMFIIKLLDEHFLHTLLQDIQKKSIKIYITSSEILSTFKHILSDQIGAVISLSDVELVKHLYRIPFGFLQNGDEALEILSSSLTDHDITSLRDNLYTFDVWLWLDALSFLRTTTLDFSNHYGDTSVLGILSMMRETLLGFFLYYTHLRNKSRSASEQLLVQAFKRTYLLDVLNISEGHYRYVDAMIEQVAIRYHTLFDLRIHLDDNEGYFDLGYANRSKFTHGKSLDEISSAITGEDIVWCRGFLKTITYYNKRYLIPK